MEEVRVDLRKQSKEDIEQAIEQNDILFEFNHTKPSDPRSIELRDKLFGGQIGENTVVAAPLSGTRFKSVTVGNNVFVNAGCLMMAAGTITIEDDVQIAANVQLISNNHDLHERMIITCKPVHIKKGAWIGAGATILPGVTIGEMAVVGAGSVVTKDVPDRMIAVGNPAKVVKSIDE